MTTKSQDVQQVVHSINDWCASKSLVGIEIRRRENPAQDSTDFEIGYEVTFAPTSLQKAWLHILVTSDGYVGIGLERWSRVATRLGVASASVTFVGGFEPRRLAEAELFGICNVVCSGSLKIYAYSAFGRLLGCVPVVQNSAFPPRSFGVPASFRLMRALSKLGWIRETELTYLGWEACD